MNKKKLSKLIEKSTLKAISEFNEYGSVKPMKVKESLMSFNDYMFTECDSEVKEKSRNMIFRLLNLRDQLTISINDHSVSISSEFGLKKSNLVVMNNYMVSNDYFSIEIIKDTGYIMSYKDKRLAYRDSEIYKDLISQIEIVFKSLNNENFKELYNEVMVDSGLARSSNLDDLLDKSSS
jgi:hypothetical protein